MPDAGDWQHNWDDPYSVENTRRSWAMLRPGQAVNLTREAGMRLLEELQRLQGEHRSIVEDLQAVLRRLGG